MKQQHINKKTGKSGPHIIDNRKYDKTEPEPVVSASNTPIRTVLFVEVGNMETLRVQLLIQEINKQYSTARGGIHYIIPVRNGKIGSDMIFEKEFLEIVNKTCEVKEGQIVLRNGATDVHVIRELIN